MSSFPIRHQGAVARSAAFAAMSACLISSAAAQSAQDGEPTDLEEISVTANKVDGPAAAIGSAVSSLSGEDLERRQIRLVSDALREMPGVAVNRTGPIGGLTQLRIRGAEGNQTLVLIDGIEVNDPATAGEFDFANLMSLEVERVDVLRGPQSALYGSDALGGVVNIVTRKGEPGPTRFRASVEGGSFRVLTGQASVSGGTETYDYLIAGQGFRTSGVSTAKRFADPAVASSHDRDGYENATAMSSSTPTATASGPRPAFPSPQRSTIATARRASSSSAGPRPRPRCSTEPGTTSSASATRTPTVGSMMAAASRPPPRSARPARPTTSPISASRPAAACLRAMR
jgi:vitamin B12 transporter